MRSRRSTFPDGEQLVTIDNAGELAGKDILVVQSTARSQDSSLLTLLQLLDAARAMKPRSLSCLVPYLCYQRQDRSMRDGEPVTARLVAAAVASAGAELLITFDRHGRPLEGDGLPRMIDLSCAELYADSALFRQYAPTVLLAPDLGAARRIGHLADDLAIPLVTLRKFRDENGVTSFSELPDDLRDARCVVIEDLCSTGSTLIPLHDALVAHHVDFAIFVTHLLAAPEVLRRNLPGAARIDYSDSCGQPNAPVRLLAPAVRAWLDAQARTTVEA
jgi:ribose-phosphate pyrophosphokinase